MKLTFKVTNQWYLVHSQGRAANSIEFQNILVAPGPPRQLPVCLLSVGSWLPVPGIVCR